MFNFKFLKNLLPALLLTFYFSLNNINPVGGCNMASTAIDKNTQATPDKKSQTETVHNNVSIEQKLENLRLQMLELQKLNFQAKSNDSTSDSKVKIIKGKLASIFGSIKDTYSFLVNNCEKMTSKKFICHIIVLSGLSYSLVSLYSKAFHKEIPINIDTIGDFVKNTTEIFGEKIGTFYLKSKAAYLKGYSSAYLNITRENPKDFMFITGANGVEGLLDEASKEFKKDGGKKLSNLIFNCVDYTIKGFCFGAFYLLTKGFQTFHNRVPINPNL